MTDCEDEEDDVGAQLDQESVAASAVEADAKVVRVVRRMLQY